MKFSRQVLLYTSILFLASCATTRFPKGTTAISQDTSVGYIPNKIIAGGSKQLSSYGTLFFDATKRSAVNTIYKDSSRVKFLAEEQPDPAITYVEKIVSSVLSNFKRGEIDSSAIKATAILTKNLTTSLSNIAKKSNSLNFLKTSLYRLNETHYNDKVDSAYSRQFDKIILYAKEIQLAELKLDSLRMRYQILNEKKKK